LRAISGPTQFALAGPETVGVAIRSPQLWEKTSWRIQRESEQFDLGCSPVPAKKLQVTPSFLRGC
jgi:hypothetical protein